MRHHQSHVPAAIVTLLLVGLATPAVAGSVSGWGERDRTAHRRDDRAGSGHDDHDRWRNRDRHGDDHRYRPGDDRDKRHRYDHGDGRWGRHDSRDRHGRHWGDHDHRYCEPHRYDRSYRHGWNRNRHDYGSHRFDVPRRLIPSLFDDLSRFLWGRHYHAAHRHYHQVYSFPVWVDNGWHYRPHAYCGDDLFAVGVFGNDGPHFSFRFGF